MPPIEPVIPFSDLSAHRASGPRSASRRGTLVLVPAIISALAGCSAYSPLALPRGATAAEVVSAMGPPTGTMQAPQRLEFARGPAGKHTYMIDFDADGRLLSWEQVLTEGNFFQVRPGQTQDDVTKRLGRPSTTFPIGRQHIVVWNYRYETPFCQWFQVSIGTAPDTLGRVTDVGFGPDPQCWSPHE
ncbi:MAG: outer membrane protein assembly factor BamE [Burkholderiaceae bacterium]|nr:outer membrane protein assembly factor BamE [Burkholderiaceae bacterium]